MAHTRRNQRRQYFDHTSPSVATKLDHLKNRKPVPVTSKLATLTPFIDARGILRVGGKLQHAPTSESAKHPVVFSPNSQLSTMIIREILNRLNHSSTERTLHELHQQYHVLQPRASIHRIIRNFFECKLRNSQPVPPLMGPPASTRQLSPISSSGLSNIGIDFFGPFHLTIFRRKVQRYGVIFTCLDFRGVHLHITNSMDLDSSMMAFSRFVDLRGLPIICY